MHFSIVLSLCMNGIQSHSRANIQMRTSEYLHTAYQPYRVRLRTATGAADTEEIADGLDFRRFFLLRFLNSEN